MNSSADYLRKAISFSGIGSIDYNTKECGLAHYFLVEMNGDCQCLLWVVGVGV